MKREEKSAVSRQRILTAAMEEISRKGYEGASLSTLCAEKEISKGLIYHYFSGKDELYLLCVEQCFDAFTACLTQAAEALHGPAREKLGDYFDARLRFFAENPLYPGIFADAVFNTPPALAESVVSQLITGDMSDLEKAEALYTWVTANVEYDQRYYSDRNAMPYESQTALGALRDGVAICGGYSHAVKLLFEKAGIPCFTVTGTCQGENHMWNIARIDGQWLWFDVTMGRGSDGQFGFLRFALKELDRNKYQWHEAAISQLLK